MSEMSTRKLKNDTVSGNGKKTTTRLWPKENHRQGIVMPINTSQSRL